MIIMQAVVVEMLWNGSGIFFCLCCCSFIWVPVVAGWCSVVVYSLDLKSLCFEISYTVEGSYSGGRYSGQSSYGGYSRDSGEGGSGLGYSGTGGGGHGGERYTDGGSYDGYSGVGAYSYERTGSCIVVMREVHMMELESCMIDKYMMEQHMLICSRGQSL